MIGRIDLYNAFFTTESKYYAKRFDEFEKGSKIQFNFWAGFFGVGWFLYRRLTNQAIWIFFLRIVLSGIINLILKLNYFGSMDMQLLRFLIIYSLSFIVLGFLGNYIYFKKAKRVVEPYLTGTGIDNIDDSILNKIRHKGGVHINSAYIYFVILIILFIFGLVINIFK